MQKKHKITYELLDASKKEKKRYETNILGRNFIVKPNVFSPKYFNDTELFAKYFPYKEGGEMLEIGTGIGAISIIAILERNIDKAIATDINSAAIENAKQNVSIHKLDDKIKVIKTNLFGKIKNKKFDVIFFNAPFCFTKKKRLTILEKSLFDYNYETINKFIRQCNKHINTNGHIFLGFSTFFGEKNKLQELVKNNKRKMRLIKKIKTKRKDQKINLEIFEIF